MDGEYQCNRNRHNLRIPDGSNTRKYTEVNFQVRQREIMLSDGSMWGKPWRFEKIGTGDISNARHSAPYNGEYVGTIEVIVLRCNPVFPNTPGAEEEEKGCKQTVPLPKARLHTRKGQAPKLPVSQTEYSQGAGKPSSILNRAQVDGVVESDGGYIIRPWYGYDGQRDEFDAKERHKINHWGVDMTGSNTGVYKPIKKATPSRSRQGKRRKADKSLKTKSTKERRSLADNFNDGARGSANQAVQATPPAVVINITQAPPQVKVHERQEDNSVPQSEDGQNTRHAARHSAEIDDSLPSSDTSEQHKIGVSEAKDGDLWGRGQHGNPAFQNSSQKAERQSRQDAHIGKKDSNITADWVDSINEDLENDTFSSDYREGNSAGVMPYTIRTRMCDKEVCKEGKSCDTIVTESGELPHTENDYYQSSRGYRTTASHERKLEKGWTKSSQPSDIAGEGATRQQRLQDLQISTQPGANSVSWQLSRDKIASGGRDSFDNVMIDTQTLGQQDVIQSPRWVPGSWARTSRVSPTIYRQHSDLSNTHNEDHYPESWTAQPTKHVRMSSTSDPATLITSPVQQHWGPRPLKSQPEPVAINGSLVPAPSATKRAYRTPSFHTDQVYHGGRETSPKMRLSGAERPLIGFTGQSSLYAIPEEVVWRKNVSHQVQSGQPAAYRHKMATPKYMDSHESPYAVFVFQYRSQPVIEQLLGLTTEEPEEQEKERLKDLTKAEIIEHYIREKSLRTRSRAASSGGLGSVQRTASGIVTTDPKFVSQDQLGIDLSSVSDKLGQFQMQNTTESIGASPTVGEWGKSHENTLNENSTVQSGKELSWVEWAGDGEKNRGWNTGDQDPGNDTNISWPEEQRRNGRRTDTSNAGSSRGLAGHGDNNWTWKTGAPKESKNDVDTVWGASKEQDQRRSSRNRMRGYKGRATIAKTGQNGNQAFHRGSDEKSEIPFEVGPKQNESGHIRIWEHQKQNSPVIGQGREWGRSQENTADNVEW
ncbi:hypothetical protein MMC11_008249 [Xylographa trunciseda]|nr:hypothetical protein [Xylographa trunciseda]